MTQTQTDILGDLDWPWWLLVAVALCLPVCIAVFWRVGKWWITDQPVPLPVDRALPAVRWPASVGLAVYVGMYLLMVAIPFVYYAAWPAPGPSPDSKQVFDTLSPGILLAQVVPPLIGLAIVTAFGRRAAATLGVRLGNLRSGLAHGTVAFAAILPVCVAALMVNIVLLHMLRAPVHAHPLLETVTKTRDPWTIALLCLQAIGLAPLAEEFLYRGVLMMTLLKTVGVVGALVVSSAVFAVVHLAAEPQAVLPLFLLGMALGYVAYRTRSLVAPIIAHALFNGLMVFGTLFGSR